MHSGPEEIQQCLPLARRVRDATRIPASLAHRPKPAWNSTATIPSKTRRRCRPKRSRCSARNGSESNEEKKRPIPWVRFDPPVDWTIEFSKRGRAQIRKPDRGTSARLVEFPCDRMATLDDPRGRGAALAGSLTGFWRYRIGSYRAVCKIVDNSRRIVVVHIGTRDKVVCDSPGNAMNTTAFAAEQDPCRVHGGRESTGIPLEMLSLEDPDVAKHHEAVDVMELQPDRPLGRTLRIARVLRGEHAVDINLD